MRTHVEGEVEIHQVRLAARQHGAEKLDMTIAWIGMAVEVVRAGIMAFVAQVVVIMVCEPAPEGGRAQRHLAEVMAGLADRKTIRELKIVEDAHEDGVRKSDQRGCVVCPASSDSELSEKGLHH